MTSPCLEPRYVRQRVRPPISKSRTPDRLLLCQQTPQASSPARRYEGLTPLADQLKGGGVEQHSSLWVEGHLEVRGELRDLGLRRRLGQPQGRPQAPQHAEEVLGRDGAGAVVVLDKGPHQLVQKLQHAGEGEGRGGTKTDRSAGIGWSSGGPRASVGATLTPPSSEEPPVVPGPPPCGAWSPPLWCLVPPRPSLTNGVISQCIISLYFSYASMMTALTQIELGYGCKGTLLKGRSPSAVI